VGLPVHPQWSRSLQYARALVCRFRACGQCFMFPESFSGKCPVLPFCSYLRKFRNYPPRTAFLNWYKFVVSDLSSLPNVVLPWASIIGWTGGQVPHFLKWGGRNVFCPPHFLGQQIFIMCRFTIFLLLILREMDISLRDSILYTAHCDA